MGYYTVFELTWDPRNETTDALVADYIRAREDKEIGQALEPDGEPVDSRKWHEHERDMRAMSAAMPGVLLILYGEGEEPGDIWREYYRGGKGYHADAVIMHPPFDESKLA